MKATTRKCKYCNQKYQPKQNSAELCPKYDCRVAHFEKMKPKIDKDLLKARKAKKRAEKEELKKQHGSYTDYGSIMQSNINAIARLIDWGQNCLAHNKPMKSVDGGHVFARKGNMNMRYNLHNIYAQSSQSNHYQADDYLMKEGVKREFGEAYLEFIISLKATPIMKYRNDELKEFSQKASAIVKELKKDLRKRSNAERIELRNKYNLQLGIYPTEFLTF